MTEENFFPWRLFIILPRLLLPPFFYVFFSSSHTHSKFLLCGLRSSLSLPYSFSPSHLSHPSHLFLSSIIVIYLFSISLACTKEVFSQSNGISVVHILLLRASYSVTPAILASSYFSLPCTFFSSLAHASLSPFFCTYASSSLLYLQFFISLVHEKRRNGRKGG